MLVFGDKPPLFDDVGIITTEPVDTFNDKSVGRLEFFYQAFVSRTVEVFAALFVDENIFIVDTGLTDCDNLAVLVLLLGGNTNVSESSHKNASRNKKLVCNTLREAKAFFQCRLGSCVDFCPTDKGEVRNAE